MGKISVFFFLGIIGGCLGELFEVFRLLPQTKSQLQYLSDLFDDSTDDGLDFWVPPRGINQTVDVMVPPELKNSTESTIKQKNIQYFTLIPDVERVMRDIEEENKRGWSPRHKRAIPVGYAGFDFTKFNEYETMMNFMNEVARRHSDIVKMLHIGWSHEGKSLMVLKIGSRRNNPKPGIWVDGGIHAREWPSPHVAIYFIHQLVTKYRRDRKITYFVDNMDWYIAPIINPDGYIFSRSKQHPRIRLWRKNRSPRKCVQDHRFHHEFREHCCRGVDLNRNFDHYFQGRGTQNPQYYRASKNHCNNNYAGEEPFSEPESKAMANFLMDPKYNIQAFVSLHTYGQIVIHPYGHQKNFYPPDIQDLREVGVDAAEALAGKFSTEYKVGSTADMLYLASGTAVDWAKSKAGIKFTFLLEMRPDRETVTDIHSNRGGFLMSEKELLPTCEETWDAMKVIAEAVLIYNNLRPR